jgi:NADP-dependent 3-hydroxy acid dehydrogenase YdfG
LIQVDAGSHPDADTLLRLLQAEASQQTDDRIRYHNGKRQISTWQAWPDGGLQETAVLPAWRADGVYLITGGAGGLGLLVAQEMLQATPAAQVILCGRSTAECLPPERSQALLHLQQRFPGRVQYHAVDLGSREAVQTLVDCIVTDHGTLTGIVHSAGVIADAFLVNKSVEQFRGVLTPKVQGTTWLDEATKDLALEFMLLFSSIAGSLGNVGQADYAAANGYLDAFAQWRNEQVPKPSRSWWMPTSRPRAFSSTAPLLIWPATWRNTMAPPSTALL